MADTQLQDVRDDARSAIDAYDSLDREERRDARILNEHAVAMHSALGRLVAAVRDEMDADASEALGEHRDSAADAVEELSDATEFDKPRYVRRACYLLRKETRSLLEELEEVAA